jgi:hypothetical protein
MEIGSSLYESLLGSASNAGTRYIDEHRFSGYECRSYWFCLDFYATMGNWRVYTWDLELMHLVFLMDAACGEGGVWMQVLYACLHIHWRTPQEWHHSVARRGKGGDVGRQRISHTVEGVCRLEL